MLKIAFLLVLLPVLASAADLSCNNSSLIVRLAPGVDIEALKLDKYEPKPTAPLGRTGGGSYIIELASPHDAERLLNRLVSENKGLIDFAQCNLRIEPLRKR